MVIGVICCLLIVNDDRLSSEPAVATLIRSIQLQTTGQDIDQKNGQAFLAFHELLRTSFPLMHEMLAVEVVSEYSLLYTWRGSQPESPGILLAAHLDVVGIDPTRLQVWDHPPFAGVLETGRIHGRGVYDNKSAVIAILAATERLLVRGFQPARTVYLAFGHDEEMGGRNGALKISYLLQDRQDRLMMVLDEGASVITPPLIPHVGQPVAFIGVAEKGELTLRLIATYDGISSHSSLPPPSSSINILGRGLARLEGGLFPARMVPIVRDLFVDLGSLTPGFRGFVLRHPTLFAPLLKTVLSRNSPTNALIRTTCTTTRISGGTTYNSLPHRAEAFINLRILHGDTPDRVLQTVLNTLEDLPIQVEVVEDTVSQPPSALSPTNTDAYRLLVGLIRNHYPQVSVISPMIVPGGTDARHYEPLTRNVFRFKPIPMRAAMASGPHGINEWIPLTDFLTSIDWYQSFILATTHDP